MDISYTVKNNKYSTVKEVLKDYFCVSDRLLLKLKRNEKIFLNNSICNIRDEVHINDIISFSLDFMEDNSNIVSTKMDLNIIYEDDSYLIVDKPAGMPVHPSILHYEDSLANGIKYYFDSINLKKKIRPVNRLDKDTSGLVILAKNEYIQEALIRQMSSNKFHKEYIAITEGMFENKSGTIDLPIGRKENSIIERCISESGSKAITHYEVLSQGELNDTKFSVVKCILETGRTHQIRVHLSNIGHPILADTLYGSSSDLINRQALHCYKLSFIHPISNKAVLYTAHIPDDFLSIINTQKIQL